MLRRLYKKKKKKKKKEKTLKRNKLNSGHNKTDSTALIILSYVPLHVTGLKIDTLLAFRPTGVTGKRGSFVTYIHYADSTGVKYYAVSAELWGKYQKLTENLVVDVSLLLAFSCGVVVWVLLVNLL